MLGKVFHREIGELFDSLALSIWNPLIQFIRVHTAHPYCGWRTRLYFGARLDPAALNYGLLRWIQYVQCIQFRNGTIVQ